ncbi:SAV_2336 N-terminal domain-related protein [Nocardia sp. XZ_19_385]|uniref:SAV_2336 N-terminal domain-related protein n=1 Tax=Nocardia sp. XZ_19_385 TaxID=2769488 RepID=UPI00188F6116|nr:SAV_2336 N-terminal domain-related protein [Nocardia sp. XZ_19_385]
MGLGEFIDAVHGLDADGELLAEALWLAKHIADQPVPIVPQPDSTETTTPSEQVELPYSGIQSGIGLTPRDPVAAALSGHRDIRTRPGEVLLSAPAPLSSAATLRGELRPLARRLPEPRQRVFDEEATVDRVAHTGVSWPLTRPALLRQRDVALVFDRHPSMAAWSGLAAGVRNIVESAGFRRVDTWYLDESGDGALRISANARAPADRPLSALRDPSGRRVIVLFSSCLGDAWSWGTTAAALSELAQLSPVAVAQPLPNNLWSRTGLVWGRERITPVIAECPSPLRLSVPDDSALLPIPILELAPGWIGPWAQLLSGQRRTAGYPLLRWEKRRSGDRASRRARQDAELGPRPLDRVRRFRAASSPDAFRLAVSLAQVPLRLPIMRLVQQAVLPGSKPSVLAEVLAGGLIEDATTDTVPTYTVPEESRAFSFRPGVEVILREAIPRGEANRVLDEVSRFIARRYDVPATTFQATVSEYSDSDRSSFAYLSPETLRRIAPNLPPPPPDPPSDPEQRRYLELARAAESAAADGDPAAALTAAREALAVIPQGRLERAGLLRLLTELLSARWNTEGDIEVLDEAIAVAKLALRETTSDDSAVTAFSAELGELLLQRYSTAGGADFLIDGVRVLRAAIDGLEPGDPRGAAWGERLGDACVWRCEAAGEPLYGWEAVDLYLDAGRAAPTAERGAVLMLKIARAYLDIADISAYPEPDLEELALDQFRWAAAQATGPWSEEMVDALRETVIRVERTVSAGVFPPAFAVRCASILASVPDAPAEALRILDHVAGTGGMG